MDLIEVQVDLHFLDAGLFLEPVEDLSQTKVRNFLFVDVFSECEGDDFGEFGEIFDSAEFDDIGFGSLKQVGKRGLMQQTVNTKNSFSRNIKRIPFKEVMEVHEHSEDLMRYLSIKSGGDSLDKCQFHLSIVSDGLVNGGDEFP